MAANDKSQAPKKSKRTAVKQKVVKKPLAKKSQSDGPKKTIIKSVKPSKSAKSIALHIGQDIKRIYKKAAYRERKYLSRRPHRSFRLTRRRDYRRDMSVPGYWSFTNYVRKTLWANKKTFLLLAVIYVIMIVVVSGVSSQETYATLAQTLKSTSGDLFKGQFGSVSQAALLLTASITNILSPDVTQAQTVLGGLAAFFGWLVTVWLLRNILAGHKPTVRDGLYNGGAPILSTIIIGFVFMIQVIPIALALIVYSAATGSGMLEGGVSAMLVWGVIGLLTLLTVFWISSTLLALVIITLPGMYPMQAIRVAGDLVTGRRIRMLLRYVWMAALVVVSWLVIMIPIILFDDWFKKVVHGLDWMPIVPISIISLSALTLIFTSSYIYLLYRKVVDAETTRRA